MEIKFNSQDVIQDLTLSSCVINQKNSLPILNSFLIELKGGYAKVTTSDSEMWLTTKVSFASDVSGFRFCINANKVMNALRNLEDMDITVELDTEKRTATFSYADGQFVIPYLNADEYPYNPTRLTDGGGFDVKMNELYDAINDVCFASSYDELRLAMNGVHFEFADAVATSIACDAYKLAKKNFCVTTTTEIKKGFTISNKTATVMKGLLKKGEGIINTQYDDNNIMFSCDSFYISARLVAGRYPNCDRIIPKSHKGVAKVEKNDFIAALKRVSPMVNSGSELVSVRFEDGLIRLHTEDIDLNTSADETVPCVFDGDGLEICFKMPILLSTLRNINGDTVIIEVTDPCTACMLHYGDKDAYLSLIMPMARI